MSNTPDPDAPLFNDDEQMQIATVMANTLSQMPTGSMRTSVAITALVSSLAYIVAANLRPKADMDFVIDRISKHLRQDITSWQEKLAEDESKGATLQ